MRLLELQAPRHLGLGDVVEAGRAAAPVAFGDLHEAQVADGAEERPRLRPYPLGSQRVARVVVGDGRRGRSDGFAR